MTLSDPIFTSLDPDQRRAVLHDGGPLLLVAGAGSGKTRAIVARIVRLLRDGVPARSILGITFTNRAAGEMRERVAKALAPGGEPSAGEVAAGSFPGGRGRRGSRGWERSTPSARSSCGAMGTASASPGGSSSTTPGISTTC